MVHIVILFMFKLKGHMKKVKQIQHFSLPYLKLQFKQDLLHICLEFMYLFTKEALGWLGG